VGHPPYPTHRDDTAMNGAPKVWCPGAEWATRRDILVPSVLVVELSGFETGTTGIFVPTRPLRVRMGHPICSGDSRETTGGPPAPKIKKMVDQILFGAHNVATPIRSTSAGLS
jgi:hypothetical protein